MSSQSDDWGTPQELYNKLDGVFNFTCDVCADEANFKHENYYSEADDGLSKDWTGVCWCNPPYGRKIKDWIKKAYEESLRGATVVMLIPARVDTTYWHDYIFGKANIYFIKGRLKFGDSKNSAPFPSAVVVYCDNYPKTIETLEVNSEQDFEEIREKYFIDYSTLNLNKHNKVVAVKLKTTSVEKYIPVFDYKD